MPLLIAVTLALGLAPARTAERLPGPVAARLVEVIDGDTLLVRARIWLGQDLETRVRLDGIDTPETRGRCAEEREMAARATALLRESIAGADIELFDVRFGKYAGRVVARVRTPDGRDLSDLLSRAGLARPYAGGRRGSWCGPGTAGAE